MRQLRASACKLDSSAFISVVIAPSVETVAPDGVSFYPYSEFVDNNLKYVFQIEFLSVPVEYPYTKEFGSLKLVFATD